MMDCPGGGAAGGGDRDGLVETSVSASPVLVSVAAASRAVAMRVVVVVAAAVVAAVTVVMDAAVDVAAGVAAGDVGLHTNFRPDRARELSRALAAESFDAFHRKGVAPFVHFACMAQSDASLPLPVAFPQEGLVHSLRHVLAKNGAKQ